MKTTIKQKISLAIFDLDGTLLDTLDDLTDSLNYSLLKHNFPARTRDETRRFVGNGIRKLIERAIPKYASTEDTEKVFQTFCDYYKQHCFDKTAPYNGITELLTSLKENGVLTAVVSNKADFAVQELCERYFHGLIDYAAGERKGIAKKPAPDSVFSAMAAFGVKPENSIYIGDSEVDVETAKNAGIDCIIVTWGFREYQFLKQFEGNIRKFAFSPEDIT